jgi:hypothetical protein
LDLKETLLNSDYLISGLLAAVTKLPLETHLFRLAQLLIY